MSKDSYNNHIIKSDYSRIEEFFDSLIWRDLKGLIEADIEDNRDKLEDPLINEVGTAVLRGAIAQSRGFLELKDDMLEVKEVQAEVAASEAAEKEKEDGNR